MYFPAERNCVPAHLSLFHRLDEDVAEVLAEESRGVAQFALSVGAPRSLGRGVALGCEAPELSALHRRLARRFADQLIPQDRQPFRPHVVVQNKVSVEEARMCLAELTATFQPWTAQALGLCWWNYMGGPWELRERFPFGALAADF